MALCALTAGAPSTAVGDTIAVQPNGKILVAGGSEPGFGMLARLDADGRLDSSFGHDGFAVNRESVPLVEVAVQPSGKVVTVNDWEELSRYKADGSRDLAFGKDGTAAPNAILEGPVAIALLPEGRIALGGNYHLKMLTHQALAYVYTANGRRVERVGELAPAASMHALASQGDGSLLMAGSHRPGFQSSEEDRSVLARLVPGAGSPYDPAFGGGAGLVTVPYPGGALPAFKALAPVQGGIYATGSAAGRMVAARFSAEGQLDAGFGSGGFADAAPSTGFSVGNDLAVQSDGKLVVAGQVDGGTCIGDVPCPLVARFLPDGELDTTFGGGGIVRPARVNGRALPGGADTVVVLPDGRILVTASSNWGRLRVFVSRLMPNGEVDPSFGDGGTTTIDACPGSEALQRRSGCLPSLRARLRLRRLSGRRAALRLKVRPDVGWARVNGVRLTLPPQLRVVEEWRGQLKATLVEEDGSRRSVRLEFLRGRELYGEWTTGSKSVSLTVPATALRWIGKRPPRRRLPFVVEATFGTRYFEYPYAGIHRVVLRRAIG
jgi:uncharacterized delta-60 repeat protein